MTKPQIWIAAFLTLFIVLFMLQKLTEEKDVPNKPNMVLKSEPEKEVTPEGLISSLGCVTCHGGDLSGTSNGPSLKNIKQYWSRDNLINYLRNPQANMNGDRFTEYKKRFPNFLMPSFGNIDVKKLGKIADYLLK